MSYNKIQLHLKYRNIWRVQFESNLFTYSKIFFNLHYLSNMRVIGVLEIKNSIFYQFIDKMLKTMMRDQRM